MAQILPPAKNFGDVVGKGLREGFQETFLPALQQQYQRGLIQKSLNEASKVAADPNSDPFQKSVSLLKALAGIPGAEKYAGTLIPQMITYSERKRGNEPGQPGEVGKGSNNFQQPQSQFSVSDLVPPNRPGSISDPNSPPVFVAPYDENAIALIRQRAREKNYTPEGEEYFVKVAQEMNENARAGYADILASYNAQQKSREDILENQKKFTTYLRENAKEFSDPDELELALKASEKYQNEPSFANRLAKVKQDLRPYQARKNALEISLERPVFGFNKDQLKLAQNNARFMVDAGQKDQLRLMIANAGHGDLEEALLLNPLSENVEKKLKGFGKVVDPQSFVTSTDPESEKYQQQLDKGRSALEKQKDLISNTLEKEIIPGNYKNPGTNLLLVRKELMDKGLDWGQAGLVIQKAIRDSGVKLDPHQEIDYQKLGYPPLGGEEYAQNVLNYYLFGKE